MLTLSKNDEIIQYSIDYVWIYSSHLNSNALELLIIRVTLCKVNENINWLK